MKFCDNEIHQSNFDGFLIKVLWRHKNKILVRFFLFPHLCSTILILSLWFPESLLTNSVSILLLVLWGIDENIPLVAASNCARFFFPLIMITHEPKMYQNRSQAKFIFTIIIPIVTITTTINSMDVEFSWTWQFYSSEAIIRLRHDKKIQYFRPKWREVFRVTR